MSSSHSSSSHNSHNSSSSSTTTGTGSSVQVVVRLRPLNEKEKKHGTLPVISASTKDKTVTVIKGSGIRQAKTSYKFDNVFTAFSTQEEVFQATLQPVIRDVLKGFESTVFAYGQTGTGKTHTMEGDLCHPDLHGVIPRSTAAIFQSLEHPHYIEKNVCVSFLEIYNEDLRDLLAEDDMTPGRQGGITKRPKLDIMEGKNGPFCRGLSETKVCTAEEVLVLMRKAQNYRQVGETNMNQQSSRSHCIFTLKVQAKRKVGDGSILEISGKLHCVDLAGSECAKSADLDDDQQASRERERMNINRSLLTLGRVVSMLKDQSQGKANKHTRIPYRDSKLTRILQESLGGRCKTCLIATVSPSISAIEESISTLNYAQAANGIINKPVISSLMASEGASSGVSIGVKNSSSTGEVGTVEHWHEMEVRLQYMQSQVEEAQQALARKHLQQQELMERTEAAEVAQIAAIAELEEVQEENAGLVKEIEQHVAENQIISDKLILSEQMLNETVAILKATQETERKLTFEAQELLSLLRTSTLEGDDMHAQLLRNQQDDMARKLATKQFHATIMALFDETKIGLNAIENTNQLQNVSFRDSTSSHVNTQQAKIQRNSHSVQELSKTIDAAVNSLKHLVDDDLFAKTSEFAVSVHTKGDSLQQSNATYRTRILSNSQNLRKGLLDAREVLGQREAEYTLSSNKMLGSLKIHVEKSKEAVEHTRESLMKAILHGRSERKEARNSLRKMVERWKSTSLSTSASMGEIAAIEATNAQALINLLETESDRHLDVQRTFLAQQSCLADQKAKHLSQLGLQKTMLETQRRTFIDNDKRANDLCNAVMANILSGVQQLIQKEVSSISQYQQKSTADFVQANADLAVSNMEFVDSFTDTFTKLETKNSYLQSHAAELRARDEKTAEKFQETHGQLLRLRNTSTQLDTSVQESFDLINDELAVGDETDQQSMDALHAFTTQQSKHFGDRLRKTVDDEMVPLMGTLSNTVDNIMSFASSDVIDRTCKGLETDIDAQIVSAMNTSAGLVDEIVEASSQHRDFEKTFVVSHKGLLDNLVDTTTTRVTELNEAFFAQETSIDDYHSEIVSKCSSNEKEIAERVKDGRRKTNAAIVDCDAFAHSVIQFDVEPMAVKERNVFAYNEDLSSTLPDHIILANMVSDDNAEFGEHHNPTTIHDTADGGEPGLENKPLVEGRGKASSTTTIVPVFQDRTNAVLVPAMGESTHVSKRRTAPLPETNTAKRVRARR